MTLGDRILNLIFILQSISLKKKNLQQAKDGKVLGRRDYWNSTATPSGGSVNYTS